MCVLEIIDKGMFIGWRIVCVIVFCVNLICQDSVIRLDSGNHESNSTWSDPLQDLPDSASRCCTHAYPEPLLCEDPNSLPLDEEFLIFDKLNMSHYGPDKNLAPEERVRRLKLNLRMHCGKPGPRANNQYNRSKLKIDWSQALVPNNVS